MRGLPLSPAAPNQSTMVPGSDIAAARRTLAQHRRQRYPYGRSCGWCREAYPCGPRRTAEQVLYAAGAIAGLTKKTGVATVPGLSHRQLRDPGTVTQAQLLMLRSGH